MERKSIDSPLKHSYPFVTLSVGYMLSVMVLQIQKC